MSAANLSSGQFLAYMAGMEKAWAWHFMLRARDYRADRLPEAMKSCVSYARQHHHNFVCRLRKLREHS